MRHDDAAAALNRLDEHRAQVVAAGRRERRIDRFERPSGGVARPLSDAIVDRGRKRHMAHVRVELGAKRGPEIARTSSPGVAGPDMHLRTPERWAGGERVVLIAASRFEAGPPNSVTPKWPGALRSASYLHLERVRMHVAHCVHEPGRLRCDVAVTRGCVSERSDPERGGQSTCGCRHGDVCPDAPQKIGNLAEIRRVWAFDRSRPPAPAISNPARPWISGSNARNGRHDELRSYAPRPDGQRASALVAHRQATRSSHSASGLHRSHALARTE